MKPCDCKDMNDVIDKLDESGVVYNGWSLTLSPMYVRVDTATCRIRIPMSIFKRFAEWYLKDQEVGND